jgi:hypothetical protein
MTGMLTVGAFPGFVWGWFHVPDYNGITGLTQLLAIYKLPFLGMLVTSLVYFVLKSFLKNKTLTEIFSVAAVSSYYWYRIPALFGYGIYRGDGMLIDLTASLPEWSLQVFVRLLTFFFFIWLIFSKQKHNSWSIRPIYADKKNTHSKKSS